MGGGICKSVIRINQLLLAHLFFFIMASVCLNGYEFFFFHRIVTCSHRYCLPYLRRILSLSQLASCCGLLTRLDFRLKRTLLD